MKITKKQTATYWKNPVNDGFGSYTFDEPEEILVRWEDCHEKIMDVQGIEVVSKAKIHTDLDMQEKEWLMLGSSSESNPQSEDTAFEIIKVEKIPSIKANEFNRKVFL